jgi:large subunit ribosomal protein L28
MARVCQVTGKRVQTGHRVSHSHRKTKRRFDINLFKKRFWLAEEDRFVKLRVSAKGLKIIDKRGLSAVVREIRGRGEKV